MLGLSHKERTRIYIGKLRTNENGDKRGYTPPLVLRG